MGIFLLFIVAGLVLSALAHLDIALMRLAEIQPSASLCFNFSAPQSSCILDRCFGDTSRWLPERQFPGILLHTLLGYEDQIYLVQAIRLWSVSDQRGRYLFAEYCSLGQQ